MNRLFVFSPAMAVGRDAATAAEKEAPSALFDEPYQYKRLQILPVEVTRHARVKSARLPFRLCDDSQGSLFWRARYRPRGQHFKEKGTQRGGVIVGQQAFYLGAHLQYAALVGGYFLNVPEPVHPHRVRDATQVVAEQIHDRVVFCRFFGVVQNDFARMGQVGVNGALHGESGDFAPLHPHEALGGKTNPFARQA